MRPAIVKEKVEFFVTLAISAIATFILFLAVAIVFGLPPLETAAVGTITTLGVKAIEKFFERRKR